MKNYKLARTIEGVGFKNDFEILDVFQARNDEAANRYAEKNFTDVDWYVLDNNDDNINA